MPSRFPACLRRTRDLILLCVVVIYATPRLGAQNPVARANALLSSGRMFAAESLYYAAVRRSPRNPAARLALGRYLAARGALRVGAVLMEEARFFGADSGEVAAQLAPVYARLGDYRALASLPATPLPPAERARAAWLRDHSPSVSGPDSTTVPYRSGEGKTLARIALRIGTDTLIATVDPHSAGLTLDTVWAHREQVKHFSGTRGEASLSSVSRGTAGVVLALTLGDLTVSNVPARFAPQRSARAATIGPDLLGTFAPTADPVAGTIVLRKSGRISGSRRGRHIPTLVLPSGLWLARGGTLVRLVDPTTLRLLRTGPWTLDPRRGEIVVAAP